MVLPGITRITHRSMQVGYWVPSSYMDPVIMIMILTLDLFSFKIVSLILFVMRIGNLTMI